MGYNIAILAERQAEPGLDENHTARLELEECIHFHLDEFRFVFTTKDFMKISEMFMQAREKMVDVGQPEVSDRMISLSSDYLPEENCLYPERWAIELTRDGTVHIHNKCLRVHMSSMDFYEYANRMKQALVELCNFSRARIDITANNVVYPSVVNEYLDLLLSYNGSADAKNVSDLHRKVKWYLTHPLGDTTTEEDLQRPDGCLPKQFPGSVPEELNTAYLFSLYESINEWGYASGPFSGDLMPVYKYPNGKFYLKGAHRTACLLSLGYTDIDVLLGNPPSGWSVGL